MGLWDAIGQMVATPVNAILGHNQNIRDRKFAESQSTQQMQFQERMSNTALQRGMKDAKAAGIHPWQIAGSGGASSPGGAMGSAPGTAPQIDMPDILSYGISLKQLEQTDRKLQLMDDQTWSEIINTMKDTELKELKKVLLQKGQVRAETEGEILKSLRNIFKDMKQSVEDPQKFLRDRMPPRLR